MLKDHAFELKPLMLPIVPSSPAFSQKSCRFRLATAILSVSKSSGNAATYFLRVAGSHSGKHSSERPDSMCLTYSSQSFLRASGVLNFIAKVFSAGAAMPGV